MVVQHHTEGEATKVINCIFLCIDSLFLKMAVFKRTVGVFKKCINIIEMNQNLNKKCTN